MIEQPWWSPARAPLAIKAEQAVDLDGKLPFRALLGFTFILLLAPQERFAVLGPLRIAMLTALLAVLAHCWCRWQSGQRLVSINAPLLLLGALVGWALLTMPFSFWPGGSLSYLMEYYLKTLIVFLLLANVISSTSKLLALAWALVLMAIPLAATTLKNFMSGDSERVMGYSASLTANPNDMALMLNLILPLAIALFLNTRKPSLKLLLAGIVGLLILAILATFSRAGFLTLGFILLSYLWRLRTRPERVWIPVVILAAVCALPLIPADYYERITTIVNIEEDASNSAQTRLADMKVALQLVASHPLMGSGIGMNVLAMNEARGPTWTEVHNVYLQLAVELGLPGLCIFLLLYRQCFRQVSQVLRHGREQPGSQSLFNVAEGLQVSLMAFGIAAVFHPVAYHYYFYYIAGMAVAAGSIRQRSIPGADHEQVLAARPGMDGTGRSAASHA